MRVADVSGIAAERQWYVAASQPGKERFAIENLKKQGFEIFYPRITRARQRKDRRIDKVTEGLFPGYLFVRFDRQRDRWQSINGTFGIRALVGVRGSEPTPLPARTMTTLIARCPDGMWLEDYAQFVSGDPIALIDGPFAGCQARFDAVLPGERVRVLLGWLGCEQALVMSASSITAANT